MIAGEQNNINGGQKESVCDRIEAIGVEVTGEHDDTTGDQTGC